MFLFILLNIFIYSQNEIQNEINIKINFNDCVTCNLSKINYIFNFLDSSEANIQKTITIFHNDNFEPLIYKNKFNADNFKIDTINKLVNTTIELNYNGKPINFELNNFCVECIDFDILRFKNRKNIIEEDNTIITSINSNIKCNDSLYILVNDGRSIYQVSNSKLINYFTIDSNFVKNTISDGIDYYHLTDKYKLYFSIFEINAIFSNNNKFGMFFRSFDTINFDIKTNEFLVKYSYFTKSNNSIKRVNNRIINSYSKNSSLYNNNLIIQRKHSYDDFKDELLISINENNMSIFLTYKDLNIGNNKLISNFYRKDDFFYFYNFDDNELIKYDYFNKAINKHILINIPEDIYMFEQFVHNENYYQLFKLNTEQIILNVYNNNNFELITTRVIENSIDLVDFILVDVNDKTFDFIIKRKKERWGFETLYIEDIFNE